MKNEQVIEKLNVTLADAIVLSQKLRNFHWYVKGSDFFTLHQKFEDYYNAFNTVIDDIAERLLTISGNPVKSLADALKLTNIQESINELTPEAMVKSLMADFNSIHSQISEVIAVSDKAGDRGTVNMLDGIKDELEKNIWMLRAYMN